MCARYRADASTGDRRVRLARAQTAGLAPCGRRRRTRATISPTLLAGKARARRDRGAYAPRDRRPGPRQAPACLTRAHAHPRDRETMAAPVAAARRRARRAAALRRRAAPAQRIAAASPLHVRDRGVRGAEVDADDVAGVVHVRSECRGLRSRDLTVRARGCSAPASSDAPSSRATHHSSSVPNLRHPALERDREHGVVAARPA